MRIIHRNTTPSLASEPAQTSLGRHLLGAVPGGPDRKSSGLHSPSLLLKKRLALPIVALLAALAVGLLFLLPGGPLHAQDADGPIMYAENGTGPVATYTAEDPEGTAITWSLLGTDAGDFDINNGVLTFKQPPNYEMATGGGPDGTLNTYSVIVVATDSSGAADDDDDEKAVTVMVTNVDEAGTLTLSTLQPVDGIPVMTTLTDIDSVTSENSPGTVTAEEIAWKWAKSLSHAGTYTDIDGETSVNYTPKPADLNHYLRATATYTDPQGSDKTEMAISAHKVLAPRSTNTAPVFKDADGDEIMDGTREVAENAAAGTDVGDPVEASDGEGDVLTYTISGEGEASFDIDRATGQIMVGAETELNYDVEDERSYTVTVTATDPFTGTNGTNSDMITVEITVTNVDEDPKLTGPASVRVSEAITSPQTVASTYEPTERTYAATDDEDDVDIVAVVLTKSGPDAALFGLEADGVLNFTNEPNFEAPKDVGNDNVYNITVVATDSDGQTDEMDVTVTVTNVEEGGTVTLSTLQPRIGTALTATLTDIDGAVSDVKWQWARSTTQVDADFEDIDDATAASYTPVMADVVADGQNYYLRATARYTDPEGSDTATSNPMEMGFSAVEIDDTNRAPEFPDQDLKMDGDQTDQERTVLENTAADMGIAMGNPVAATDPNDGDNDVELLTYTLGGTDAASFNIDKGTGQLQTKAALNKEEKDTYMVTVTATDPSGLSATINVTIKVTNVNEDPELAGMDSVRVPENTAVSTAVETYMATDDEDDKAGTAIIWSLLGGTDDGVFDIDEGVLTFKQSPNYEGAEDQGADNVYNVTVVATDSDDQMDTMTVIVMVTDVDEAGTLTLSTLQPVDGIPVMTTLTDIDGAVMDTAWKWAKSRNHGGAYTDIDGATADMYTPDPDDLNHYLRATATYTDPQGSDKTEMVISARKVVISRSTNTPPVFKDADGDEIMEGTSITREVAENTRKGEPVGPRVVATDSEGDVLTYTLGGTNEASFDIDVATGQLRTKVELDREADGGDSYMVTVTATDPFTGTNGTNSDMITVDITVTNVDEAPELTGMESIRILENTAVPAEEGTYTATDDEDASDPDVPLTLSGADAADFNLTNGALTFKQSPNYEAPADAGTDNVYNVTVVATDSDNQTDMMAVTVMVTNADEAGTLTLSTVQPRVGTPLTATLTDIDGAVSDVTWMWERADNMAFGTPGTIEGADSGTYTPTDDDNGKYLRATATSYTDPQGSGHTATPEAVVTANGVEIDDTNKAPEFPDQDMETDGDQTDQERMVAENTDPIGMIGAAVVATDPNMDTLTYALGGTDAASFSIVRTSGQLQPKAALNKEEKDTYMVTVTATDPSGLNATINVTIKVTNVDEPPVIRVGGLVISGRSSISNAENATGPVATYMASGPNADMASWTLSGDDMGDFMFSGGTLTFRSSPDYENPMDADMDNVYMVTITADDGTYIDTHDVMVMVTNEDEPGEVTLWAGTDALTMAPQVGETITGAVMDPDGGVTVDSWQWAKTMDTADMNSWMDIQSATNAAYMVMAGDTGYYLRVMATYTDAAGTDMAMEYSMPTMATSATPGIPVNIAPMFATETAERMVPENTAAGEPVGDPVTAMDDDTGDTLTYSLSGTDMASFAIDPGTGQIKVGATTMLDYEATQNTYMVTVTATDDAGATDTIDVTITVTDEEETGEDTLLSTYDANNNGKIDRDEVFTAIDDYFDYDDRITLEEVFEIVGLYFANN